MKNQSGESRLGRLGWAFVVAVAAATACLLLFAPHPSPMPATESPAESTVEGTADVGIAQSPGVLKSAGDWGIEVVALYLAMNGRVLDLRYRILDKAKAATLPNEPGNIYLVDEATGVKMMLPNSPKTGSIPQNPQKLEAGRTYSLAFPNLSAHFRSGNKLTLVMGALRAEHLTVQ